MKGIINQWRDDKGFGFIQPDDGSEKLFFHISSVKTAGRRPQVGDSVLYDSMRDSQQRLKAKSVVIQDVANASPAMQIIRTEPPRKDIIDYVSFLILIGSVAMAAFGYYRSGTIENVWFYGVFAAIAFFLLNRQKKPKEKLFSCSRCKKLSTHNPRTIKAWNRGLKKLYCHDCHRVWLANNVHGQAISHNDKVGCLSVLACVTILPVSIGIGLCQWLL